jgi:hypothetical protein
MSFKVPGLEAYHTLGNYLANASLDIIIIINKIFTGPNSLVPYRVKGPHIIKA